MTQRAAKVILTGPVNSIFRELHSQKGGFIAANSSAVPDTLVYKNQGWYATGGIYETWLTLHAPSSTPPSGHTLTGCSFVAFKLTLFG